LCHALITDTRFWPFLLDVDRDLAEGVREGGCPICGEALHRSDYPRKPRGAEDLPEEYSRRFSFSCSADRCRRRATPPSVRFLGQKVYLKVIVLLVTAMRQGATPRSYRELERLFSISRRTLRRWQSWWQDHFPRLLFWKRERARFAPLLDETALPSALLTAFDASPSSTEKMGRLLLFLSPITTREGARLHGL
jgi:hypothetical protein